jgi:two-component system phosphate regulon response regulator PhoB
MATLANHHPSPRNSREPIRILIVEDDPGSRWALGALFKRLGYHCVTAADGNEGLTLVDAFRPQIILTDMMMPGMDGLEFIRRLKADDRTRSIPVLMLTADATGLGESAARAAGCDGLLSKPIVMAELVSRIQSSVRLA